MAAATSGPNWLAKFLFDQGLRGEDLKRMWAIGMRESGGRPSVDNAGTNSDGSIDYGLFQINGSAHGAAIQKKFGWSMDDLRDPVKNFQVMNWMSKGGKDLSAWGVANADGSVSGWAASIGDAQRAKFTGAMNAQMAKFDTVAKRVGIDVSAPAGVTTASTGSSATGTGAGTGKGGKLTQAALEARYKTAYSVITSDPELFALWKEATNAKTGYMSPAEFQVRLQDTGWYKRNAQYARDAIVAEARGGADWAAQQAEAAMKVQAAAVKLGVWDQMSPQQRAAMAHRYIFEGWGDPAREQFMADALAGDITSGSKLMGSSANLQETLMTTAQRNGVKMDPSYYTAAAKSVAMGLKTPEDFQRELRTQAASYWPGWSDKIMAGVDAKDLASGYINTMASTLEIDPNSIDLNDARLRSAMTGVDEKGNPKQMGLWEFEQSLRKDPSWKNTKQAEDTTVNIGTGILRRMGFLGG